MKIIKKLIVGNWKMQLQSYKEAEKLAAAILKSAQKLKNVETVLCPPFVYIQALRSRVYEVKMGAQDVFWEDKGAFTGEISPAMLKNSKVKYAIIGHSERRRHLGETDEMINKKVRAALKSGLNVILCIGETLKERKRKQTKSVLRRQLHKDLADVRHYSLLHTPYALTIAYEPVWAIGSGLPETPQNADSVAGFIRQELCKILSPKLGKGIRIIYGGSVNSKNIGGYLVMPSISGALVGGASLGARDFGKILKIANNAA